MDQFTTLKYLLSFPGMVAAVVLLSQFTKGMFDKLVSHQTKYVVYVYSLILCIVAALFHGKFVGTAQIVETSLVWMVNSIIVWFAAMKAFEMATRTAMASDGILQIDTSDPDKDMWRLDFGDKLPDVENKKTVTLKVNTNADLRGVYWDDGYPK